MQVTFTNPQTQEILAQADVDLNQQTLKLEILAQGSFDRIHAICEDALFFYRIDQIAKRKHSIILFGTVGRGIKVSTPESVDLLTNDDHDEDLDI